MWTDDVENVEANRQMLQDLGYEIDIKVLDEVGGEALLHDSAYAQGE